MLNILLKKVTGTSKFDLERNALVNEPVENDRQVFTKVKIEDHTTEDSNITLNSYLIFLFSR